MRADPGLAAARAPGGGVLLERERELTALREFVAAAAAGDARVALVEGAAGIGKTRLVAEARRIAADAGMRVLSARGGELEREFAFGVVRQLFEPVLALPEARERLFDGAAGAAAPVFEHLDAAAGGGDSSFAALHGLYWLTVNLSADGPVLLAVDDLHWCDRPSLRFLAYLVRRLEGLPVALLCSLRPAEPGTDTALVAELAGDPLTASVHPGTLSRAAVGRVVRDRLGEEVDDAFLAACHAATGGNPLFVHELVKALEAEGVRAETADVRLVHDIGPRAASRAVLLRLARLPHDAVEVAHALAVLGDGAELAHVAGLAEVDIARAAAATGLLARSEILRPEPPLGFVHPLVAAAVYRDIPPGRRELRHERAARLLAAADAPHEQVAAHLLVLPGRGEPWVVETLRAAAAHALRKGAADSAVSYLARALAEPPPETERTSVLLELGSAEALTHGPAAVEHLREAFEALHDPVARGQTARVLALALLQTGAREESADVARRAAADLPPDEKELRRALEGFEIATAFFGVERSRDLLSLVDYRDDAGGSGAGTKMLQGLAAMQWAYAAGPADRCAQLAIEALEGGVLLEADNGFFSIAPIYALTLADRDEAMEAWDASMADAHRRGSLYSISSIHLWRSQTLLRRGELVDAQEEAETAAREFELWGFGDLARIYSSAFIALPRLERGDLAGARTAIELGSDPGLVADGVRFWLNARLEVLVAEGRFEEALETAAELERRFDYCVNPAAGAWRSLKAQALARLGRDEEALAAAAEEVRLARAFAAPWGLGRALRVLGTLEGEAGIERLREAVEVLEGSPARLEQAKALGALGKALRLARRPTEAREPLRRALELASICGASALCEELRAELQAAGVRPRTSALQGVAALTASERRVASLAAEGQTNRDIAQTLYVTPKTVEVHLSNAYRKLGIRSRRELADVL